MTMPMMQTQTGLEQIDPFRQEFVSIDLETTGLNPHGDTIIEVGAVKVRNGAVLERFQTFVNPGRGVPQFIQQLTSISPSQLERAPSFSQVAGRLADFLGDLPIIGHNIKFDLDFLASHRLDLLNRSYNTYELAAVFLPAAEEYNLSGLAQQLGIEHSQAHRASADAEVTAAVFHRLLQIAAQQPAARIAFIARTARIANAAVADLLEGLIPYAAGANSGGSIGAAMGPVSAVGLDGLDQEALRRRLSDADTNPAGPALRRELTERQVEELLAPGGIFAREFPGFEERPQQSEMLKAVTRAVYQGRKLVVEGGTGIGKSLAYLLPSVIYAAGHGEKVVISTNTINLQEQLLNKDIPAVISILENAGILHPGAVRAAQLKGRSNYICLKRWQTLAQSDTLSEEEARVIGKTAVWLDETDTGDRSGLNLHIGDLRAWSRICAITGESCPALHGSGGEPCFLRQARHQAEAAHILVINHALLLADMAFGGNAVPEYHRLVIDEAHHLEDEASRQLGFEIAQDALPRELESVYRALNRLTTLAGRIEAEANADRAQHAVSGAMAACNAAGQSWGTLWDAVTLLYKAGANQSDNERGEPLTLDDRARQSREWGAVAAEWESAFILGGECVKALQELARLVGQEVFSDAVAGAAAELAAGIDAIDWLNERLASVFGRYETSQIQWLIMNRRSITLHSAPLDVGPVLRDLLFGQIDSVVLTSATLATDASFDFLRQRVGFPDDSDELLVDSPFNYRRNTLLMVPEDLPDPRRGAEQNRSTAQAIINMAQELDGHVMALFTSHSALREASYQVRNRLHTAGIGVLAQGIDGTPRQLIDRLQKEPRSVLLGTASFWEGVDLESGVLRGLLLCRLPFPVPTDPVVKARSNRCDNPFNDYQVPTAVLRFRQGFGRLIRNKMDRGAVVILDRRIQTANYGDRFFNALPACAFERSSLATVGQQAARWLQLDRAPRH